MMSAKGENYMMSSRLGLRQQLLPWKGEFIEKFPHALDLILRKALTTKASSRPFPVLARLVTYHLLTSARKLERRYRKAALRGVKSAAHTYCGTFSRSQN